MTETQDQLSVLPSTGSVDSSATSAAQERAKRRSGSLATMLLPELQALAASMGIATGKLRKSDLVAAIETARRPSQARSSKSSTAGTGRAASRSATGASATSAASTSATSATSAASNSAVEPTAAPAKATRARRTATRAAGAPQQSLIDEIPAEVAPPSRTRRGSAASRAAETTDAAQSESGSTRTDDADDAGSSSTGAGRQNGRTSAAQPATQARDGRDAQARDTQQGQTRDGQTRDGQARDGQSSGNVQARDGNLNRDGQNNRNNNRNANREGVGRNQNNAANNGPGNEDDDEFGSRRGRRYRDRRGRNRERADGAGSGSSSGRNEVEPTISDDDVLSPVAGILDNVDDKGSWFIRVNGYFATSDDVYVANSHVRKYGLRRGDAVTGVVRQPRDGERKEKFNPLVRLDSVNGADPDSIRNRVEFTKLTPLYPQERLRLETESNILTTRVIDLVMPIGKGQRALIVSPPKAGKTMIMQAIANAIATNNPECHLMVVLIDERPEEVTDMQRSVKGEVIASTFDRRPQDHTMVAELSIERAKRLVEMGHDVVVLLDSITRLGRAYNLGAPASGRILSGGVDSTALYPPKRFLGAARNIENGGSLTIIASALVETGSAGDTVIFEEFKGTGNAELRLDRKIADKRVFPAVDVDQSSTRKEEILLSPDELAVVIKLRRVLHSLDPQQGIDLLLDRLRKTRTNIEFLMQIAKTTPGGEDR